METSEGDFLGSSPLTGDDAFTEHAVMAIVADLRPSKSI
jgi:hypothetical protein